MPRANTQRKPGAQQSKPGGGAGGGSKPGAGQGAQGSGTQSTHTGGQSFWDFNPRNIAGTNAFQTGAGNLASRLPTAGQNFYNQANQYLSQLGGGSDYYRQATDLAGRPRANEYDTAKGLAGDLTNVARRQVTGENIESDPAFNAARRAYSNSIAKRTNNAAALAGLGRSTSLQAAQGAGEANYLLPTVQETLAREERGIGREMSGLQNQIQTVMGAGGAEMNRRNAEIAALQGAGGAEQAGRAQAASGFAGLGGAENANLLNSVNAISGLGNQFRGIEQEQLDAPYQEQQRLWAEALNSMYGPLGMVGSMLGGSTSSSKK